MNLTEPLEQLDDSRNLNNYKLAGKIATKVLDHLVKMCKSGSRVYDLCAEGDRLIQTEVNKVKSNIEFKGVAFPTCVSINSMAGFFSPTKDNSTTIAEGDLVKIELGVHIDGFPALVCFTVVINETDSKISGPKANAVKAIAEASKKILQVMKPGKTNTDVVKIMEECAKKYNCQLPCVTENMHSPGVISFQMSRYIIDGYNEDDDEYVHRFILARTSDNYDFSMHSMELEKDEVYSIDILMSTGTGKLHKEGDATIYKRIIDKKAPLKLKTSKAALSSFSSRFPVRIDDTDSRFKFGLKECITKELIEAYTPASEKKGEYVARCKFTVIVRDNPILICGRPANQELKKLV